MAQFYYYDFLKNHAIEKDAELLDLLKFELDKRIYYYGQHFKTPYERIKRNTFKNITKQLLKELYWNFRYSCAKDSKENKKVIQSNAYFSVNSELSALGYNVIVPPWYKGNPKDKGGILPSASFYKQTQAIYKKLGNNTFTELLSNIFKDELYNYIESAKNVYKKNVDALIVPNDLTAMERIAIKVFKDIQKPSFIFLHGLPGRYNRLDENRTDYLIVWGDKIKEHYINQGVSPDKIFVSGHPNYKTINTNELRFSLENVLIITKSLPGAQQCSDHPVLFDRGNIVLYLHTIQSVLQKLGVKSARFRPHPSEDGTWYLKHIDKSFYKLDGENIIDSLKKSSLIIGSTSTTMLEAIYYGINYIVFEPAINNISLEGLCLVPPFDGSDSRLPVAKDESALYDIIKDKQRIDTSIWNDYIKTPFDMSFIKTLI